MPKITEAADIQTVITTFEMTPGTCQDLLDALKDAYGAYISKQPGFISAGLHVNDAQTRIANYSQWRRREDFLAMLRYAEMRERNRKINELCRSFEPVMYEVSATFESI
ncbi:antibiotic biosynthesis monooxygenase domain protein [Roseobacter sp. MED193]|uniref:antibiotic biosynthesis monooxygenase family protein n=1 Tax=Roseobacter sp. MED193 TaxID=314262 RepID=UPI0000689D50|nr:antibiotic biosynthesis monooxygenase [Roseobacter sp. MED193]EAQ44300.1 antibiotic biosynthesis monooxygenase domain protein [Roseobacter sp. MED193]